MKLKKRSFVYGNVKPDLSKDLLSIPHTLENYFLTVCNNADNLMSNKTSLKEFSFELGKICHYVCDFFCEYHLNEEIFHRKDHFFYELMLHLEFLYNFTYDLLPSLDNVCESISSIVLDLRKKYLSDPVPKKRDLKYALLAATLVCETVYYYSTSTDVIYTEEAVVSHIEKGEFITYPMAGGGL